MILVTTHQDTDFDGAAGMLAATLLHEGSVVVFPGSREALLRRYLDARPGLLPEVRARDVNLDEVDTLVLVDTLSADRIGRFAQLLEPGRDVRVIAYDHHGDSGPAEGIELHSARVGAVTTLLVQRLEAAGIRPSPEQATLLALGIYEDTGCLLFEGTRPEDLRAVSWLLEQGADLKRVGTTLSRGLSREQVEFYHDLLQEVEIVRIRGREVEMAVVSPEAFVSDASVVVQQYAEATGSQRLVTLIRMDDRIFMIVRSRARDFDASALASRFGGGGHHHAASATIHARTLIEVRASVLEALQGIVTPVGTAADLATPILHWLPADATIAEGVRSLNRYRVNGLPVMEGGRVIGALTRQAADIALHHGMGGKLVRDLVTEEAALVAPGDGLDIVEERLLAGGTRFLMVGESTERVRGVITRTALLRYLAEAGAGSAGEPVVGPFPETEAQQDISSLVARRLTPGALDVLHATGRFAVEDGTPAYLVGGVVRDLLLGRENRDLDVVVEGDACSLARRLADRIGGQVRIHAAFQTAAIYLPDGQRLDLATARTEHYPRAGDLPSVEPSSLRQDLFRRDFTINTLALTLEPTSFGRLLDYFGGRKDLARGKIRVLHGVSFVEDPTRAYRAVRFALRLKFEISRETAHLIRAARAEGVFSRLSGSRLRREIEVLFAEGRLGRTIETLERYDLLAVVHEALRTSRKIANRLDQLDQAIAWYSIQERGDTLSRWTLAMGVLAERLDPDERSRLWERLAPTRDDLRILQEIPDEVHALVYSLSSGPEPGASAIYRACSGLSTESLLLAMAFARREPVREAVMRYLTELRDVSLDIRGSDLLEAGVSEGPAVSRGLRAALNAKLDHGDLDADRQLEIALGAARER